MMTFMLFLLSPDTFWHLKVASLKWCFRCSCCCCLDDIGLNYNRIWFTYFCFFVAALQLLWSLLRRYLPLLLFYTFSHNGGYYLTSLFCFSPSYPFRGFLHQILFLFIYYFFFSSSLFLQTFLLLAKYRSGRVCMCVFVCTTEFLC